MKTRYLAVALTITIFLTGSALAGDKAHTDKTKVAEKSKAKPKQKQVVKAQKIAVTGSYIKEEVRPDGTIPTGPSPLHIIDSESIRNSGGSDVAEVLIKKGYNR